MDVKIKHDETIVLELTVSREEARAMKRTIGESCSKDRIKLMGNTADELIAKIYDELYELFEEE